MNAYGLGRAATAAEVHAWDIDVRPDFKGLPPGSGTVERGNTIWDSTCASCHGTFGESNEVFTPIVGGTTDEDIKTGHVASLLNPAQPVRTTFMKVDTISTMWDFIYRAMPWNKPKSLKPDDVYAVLAYLLNLAEIVPDDYTLSDKNIAEVQARMPNRNGMVFWKGLWDVDGKPDTHNTACMQDCMADVKIASSLPAYARDSNGDLAAQMRIVGPVRGADTVKPALAGTPAQNAAAARQYARGTLGLDGAKVAAASGQASAAGKPAAAGQASAVGKKAQELLKANGCTACHAVDKKVLGPSFIDIAKKYKGQGYAIEKLAKKVRDGGSGVWGSIPMPPHPDLGEADLKTMLEWILAGAGSQTP
ncbi:cytochrome C [Candidimonas nitroreducens]|uniref:Cytochrome C n=2 Tax=Candidimonas nitroreducens TaxID=683354 RepID=A0A225MLS1_9BURK|nr:c-type cytochrome [Candidimonas nitroreducens]OWT62144.1 cytochrome C [Candidimonas nitroreducens]